MNKSINDQLAETRNQLLCTINSLTNEELNMKPASDKWSISQVCHHLYLAERTFTLSIIYGLKKGISRKADPKPIQFAADRSIKVDAPEIVLPGEVSLTLEQIVEELDRSREILFEVLSRIEDKSLLAQRSAKHPLFGHLPLDQWVELIYLHEQRHIEQIEETKSYIR
jgi:hypothetical protein